MRARVRTHYHTSTLLVEHGCAVDPAVRSRLENAQGAGNRPSAAAADTQAAAGYLEQSHRILHCLVHVPGKSSLLSETNGSMHGCVHWAGDDGWIQQTVVQSALGDLSTLL